jgi:YHS domain-containing protein
VIRVLLLAVLMILVARAFWQVMDGIFAALGSTETPRTRGGSAVKLVRDPVCGTYVTPNTGLSVTDGRATYYFCSDQCRAKFQKQSSRS